MLALIVNMDGGIPPGEVKLSPEKTRALARLLVRCGSKSSIRKKVEGRILIWKLS